MSKSLSIHYSQHTHEVEKANTINSLVDTEAEVQRYSVTCLRSHVSFLFSSSGLLWQDACIKCVCVCVCVRARAQMCAKSIQFCQTLCNSMDCSLPDSSVHRILQARILEWVAMLSSRGLSNSGISCLLHWLVSSLTLVPPLFSKTKWTLPNFSSNSCHYHLCSCLLWQQDSITCSAMG